MKQRERTSNPVRSVRLRHGTLKQAVGCRFLVCRKTASERELQSKPLQPVEILRSSNCWSLRLALNQKLAGSIPVSGAVAVLYWFRNLAVNQVYVGSIPIGHPWNRL